MTLEKCAFCQIWETGGKYVFVCLRISDRSPHPTVNKSQYGDPRNRYACDKQGHVTKIYIFIMLNQIL